MILNIKKATLVAALGAAHFSVGAASSWDIEYLDTDVSFEDSTAVSEVNVTYEISNNAVTGSEFKIMAHPGNVSEPCTAATNNEGDNKSIAIYDISTGDVNSTTNMTKTTVSIDIVQSKITSSDFYEADGNETGKIKFCLRGDLNTTDSQVDQNPTSYSVSFEETLVEIDLNLTQAFDVESIVLDRTDALNITENATVDYNIEACQCSGCLGDCVNDIISQNQEVSICIRAPELESNNVADIKSLVLQQTGTPDFVAVEDYNFADVCTKTCDPTGVLGCCVKCMVVSQFFTTSDPGNITGFGVAVIGFGRLLAETSPSSSGRTLQEDTGNFEFSLSLQGDGDAYTADTNKKNIEIKVLDSAAASTTHTATTSLFWSFLIGIEFCVFFMGIIVLA
jgi:hypothetical protein